jgi:outer membrane receptor for ferrienterochelin and colicins
LFLPVLADAQNNLTVIVRDKEEGRAMEGVTINIDKTDIVAYADSFGIVRLQNIPDGEQTLAISYLGYFRKKIKVVFPRPAHDTLDIKLESQKTELEEVVIVSTRNEKKPEDLPLRVEAITEEDVEERSHDKPSDVSHVLREQPGVQVQRTSATGGTMSIRLQGLKSRYVQVLKDGFPVFGGFANVIGITQIPPLDIRQVEIIKGPSSTLYGGNAISGVINLISKEPSEKPVYDIMANGESSKAADAGVFASQRFKWFAFSLMGMYRYQAAKDWDGDGFTETPQLQRYTVSPQLFFQLSKNAKLNIGAGYTHENRLGGSLQYIQGKSDSTNNYYERNLSDHLATNLRFEYSFNAKGKLTVKNSVNYFMRELRLPYYFFSGTQLGWASEVNYHFIRKKHDVVLGLDMVTDLFTEKKDSALQKRDYKYYTGGFFGQYMFLWSHKTTLEAGLRIDYNNVYKVYALPHLAFREKWSEVFTTRLNMGMGYKLPTVFQEEAEEARFVNVLPIADSVKPELSLGGTLDLLIKLPNYNGFTAVINQLYFITHIFNPLLPFTSTIENCTGNCDQLQYTNAKGFQESKGIETSLRMGYRGANLQVVYTLTDNSLKVNNVRSIAPLTSKHIVSMLAGYETKMFGAGIDCYYYSPVKLSDGTTGKSIWEVGLSVQVSLKYVLLFANLENIFDIRQTSFGPIVHPDPTYARPKFSEIYAPLEGRLFNAGFKLHLGAFSKKYKGEGGGIERISRKDTD